MIGAAFEAAAVVWIALIVPVLLRFSLSLVRDAGFSVGVFVDTVRRSYRGVVAWTLLASPGLAGVWLLRTVDSGADATSDAVVLALVGGILVVGAFLLCLRLIAWMPVQVDRGLELLNSLVWAWRVASRSMKQLASIALALLVPLATALVSALSPVLGQFLWVLLDPLIFLIWVSVYTQLAEVAVG